MANAPEQPRFLTDAMLAGLTRWLRVLDFDTLFNPAADDRDLVTLANQQQRLLLTRDRHLIEHLRPHQGLLLRADKPLAQLREVAEACQLPPPGALFTRCLKCNQPLHTLPPDEAMARVPPESREHVDNMNGEVRQCPQCQRVYWEGSHTRRMRASLAAALPEWFSAPG